MQSKIRKALIVLFSLILIGCAVYLITYITNQNKADQADQKAQEAKVEVKKEEPKEEESKKADIPIDFAALQETNSDVYAWIQIPGTAIDYPVVQHSLDDLYYLEHTWEGEANSRGAIFTQKVNSKDFTDYNTLIYGHEMGNGTMFNDLHNYMEEGYMQQHQEIIIYTEQYKLTYRIFAAVVYDDRHVMNAFNFIIPEDRQAFLDSLKTSRDLRNQYDDSVQVTTDDKLVTLSTCLGNESNHRLLVGAVLVNEE